MVFRSFFSSSMMRIDFAAHLRIEPGRGLVEKEHARLVHQRHGQGQALFLAAGELRVEGIALLLQSESLEQGGGIAAALIEAGKHGDGFADAELIGKRGGLQDGADLLLEVGTGALRVQAADADDAAVGRAEAFEDFHGAGFAGAVRPQQAKDFAFLDFEADATQGLHGAVVFGQVNNLDDRSAHGANGYL